MRSAGASRYFKFQSFFYWNCLGGTSFHALSPSSDLRFNPSFTGIALVAKFFYTCLAPITGFQSFFYWNCLGGLSEPDFNPALNFCFNPSFTGIALVALG